MDASHSDEYFQEKKNYKHINISSIHQMGLDPI